MTFEEILDQAIAMLQRRGRLTYGALKRQFQLDDAYLEDVKAELIEGQRLAADEDGRVLVWTGGAGPPPESVDSPPQQQEAPLAAPHTRVASPAAEPHPAPFPAHAVIRFDACTPSQIEKKAKRLKAMGEDRGWLHQAESGL